MHSSAQFQYVHTFQRNVSSTARLFNFNRPVYMSDSVWKDCVELADANGRITDELAVLQRLRHVLFMASTALHGRVVDLECEFSIQRVPNDGRSGKPKPVVLKLVTNSNDKSQPQVTITHSQE